MPKAVVNVMQGVVNAVQGVVNVAQGVVRVLGGVPSPISGDSVGDGGVDDASGRGSDIERAKAQRSDEIHRAGSTSPLLNGSKLAIHGKEGAQCW